MHKTKIVATLGPTSEKAETVRQLMLAGVNVFRCNFSHGDHNEQLARVNTVKKLRDELQLPIALLADTRGPEIRLGMIPNGPIELKLGQKLTLTTEMRDGNADCISVNYAELPADVSIGGQILLDDGLIALQIDRVDDKNIYTTVLNNGEISSRKGVNAPGAKLRMPVLSEIDRKDLQFAVENDFDFIAVSFTRNAGDVAAVRTALQELGGAALKIIAKIENAEGVEKVDEIFEAADGLMVARGDMGVEIALEELPIIQKKLIRKGLYWGKPVITATQMLESMTEHPRPTRAEVTDVANAIYDNTSAIMLSGETAKGLYPVEAVKTMVKIAESTENTYIPLKTTKSRVGGQALAITHAISHSTCLTAEDLDAKAIITVTKSGGTVDQIAKHRPHCLIIGCTPDEKVYRQLSLQWGVLPLLTKMVESDTEALLNGAIKAAMDAGYIQKGDVVVMTAGLPLGESPATNTQRVHVVGERI